MKKIFLVLALALPFAVASCDKANVGALFSGEENLVTFAQSVISDDEVNLSATEYTVPIRRQTNQGEYKISIACNTFHGKIKVPQSEITFADGEYEAGFKLDVTDIVLGEKDTVSLKINAVSEKVSTPIDSCTVILAKGYTWNVIGNGEFYDGFLGVGPVTVEIQKADGFEVYRAYEPYPEEAMIEAEYEASGAWGYGGDECEYIEFAIADDKETVTWKTWSTTIDYSGDGDTIYAYYLPTAKGCTAYVADENVILFYPYWYVPGIGGWGAGKYWCAMTLPGGPDLEEWLTAE